MEVQFIDDLDGSSPADTTISFGVDGTSYEIDLSAAHAEEFREAMRPFIAGARRTGTSTRRAARPARASGPSPSAVREWAKGEGIKVSDRGRVPAELTVRFREANVN